MGSKRGVVATGLVLMSAAAAGAPGAASAQGATLTPDDYRQWERLGSYELDPTGAWLSVSISRVDESRELRVHPTAGAAEPIVLEHGSGALFSRDGRWLAYRKGVSPEEAEASDEPIRDRLGLVDLGARTDTVLFDVARLSFRDDGRWLAALTPSASDTVGADLVVMRPGTTDRTLIGNVADFAWQDEGGLLAATLRTAWGSANGVVLFDPEAGTLRTLDSREAEYRALTWDEDSSRLAVMRSVGVPEDDEEVTHDVLLWDDPVADRSPRVLAGEGRPDIVDTLRVTEHAGIGFGDDGRVLFVGLRPWDRARATDGDVDGEGGADPGPGDNGADGDGEPDGELAGDAGHGETHDPGPADVQVWHWNDDEILRAQEWRAGAISRRTLAAAWHLADDRVVVLGDELDEPVRIVAGGRWGVVADTDPYAFPRRFGAGTADWYRVDVVDGRREVIATGLEHGLESREDASYALFYDHDGWSSVDLSRLTHQRLAAGMSFTRALEDYDYPGARPAWGVAAWLDDTDEVLLYDRNDVWRAGLGGGPATRVTAGAESDVRYRVVNLDPDGGFGDATVLGADEAVWLTVTDLRSKAAGYARLDGSGRLETLVHEDARVVGLERARDVERYALRMERWDDSPDVFVGGAELDGLRQVTATNPFQDDYAWGRTELLDYTTDAGHELQAILAYPADFEEGRRYPLILYQYERLSDGLHDYRVPSERTYYDFQTWSQQGYFVLMPDIVYEPGRPGPSALDAVEHALDAAVATGHVDADAMGLIGHSWGGYQASYLPTRTDRFAASVAGAAITNFLSFMGAVHWNGGFPETGHWETGQARMAAPYWEDMAGHLESSPAHFIADLDTPMLLMHGDADGVVDFYQGMEFYNYARRAGKEVVLLVYPGADHGLREEAQQVDYHRRILEWFGHYLKGEPAAEWIEQGESWVDRERRIGG